MTRAYVCQNGCAYVCSTGAINPRCSQCGAPPKFRSLYADPSEGRVGFHLEANTSGGQLISGNSPT